MEFFIKFSCVNPIQGLYTCPTLRTWVCNNMPLYYLRKRKRKRIHTTDNEEVDEKVDKEVYWTI